MLDNTVPHRHLMESGPLTIFFLRMCVQFSYLIYYVLLCMYVNHIYVYTCTTFMWYMYTSMYVVHVYLFIYVHTYYMYICACTVG